MVLDTRKFELKRDKVLKDPRSHFEKFKDKIRNPQTGGVMFAMCATFIYTVPEMGYVADVLLFYNTIYFFWLLSFARRYQLPFKMPKSAKRIDPNNKAPGTNSPRMADGILYVGNDERTKEEIWFTNTDARTHILYLGTTGSGKTEGLKSMVTNALGWGSGFIYVDGKADTDLWGSLSALARRYGRDDDLLILNYMTGNSDARIASNTVNPFSQGSASYLTNLLVSLMPEVQGDNAMWKDRAVALVSALMPVLTWQRTYQEKVLNISTIRDSLIFKRVIEMSRKPEVPERLRKGLHGYLDTLPGYTEGAFNDDGTEKPNPGGAAPDYGTIYQQHGYLAMQFTRQLQSLADDYGYIFETPAADIDMMDVVLNRRIVVVLIPALEKSADETANLGKIVGSMLKGMMGATLGSSVEGDTDVALENKPTRSSTPFMAVFDEVGYYTTQGMAVMAAQARSLGFCLIFAAQDLPAMEKRVKEEARSIVANCNLKIFGKLEDPTQTKEFFEKTVGDTTVIESSTRKQVKAMFGQKKFDDTENYSVTTRVKASYDQLKAFKEGQSVVSFGDRVVQARMFFSQTDKIKALRVNRFIAMQHPDPEGKRGSIDVDAILERMRDTTWTAHNAAKKAELEPILDIWINSFRRVQSKKMKDKRFNAREASCVALVQAGFDLKILGEKDLKAPAATGTPQVSAKKQVSQQSPTPALTASDDDRILKAPQTSASKTTAKPSEKAATQTSSVGTEETLSWHNLVADDGNAKEVASPKAAEPKKQNLSSVPSSDEAVSWKDLMAAEQKDKTAKPSVTPAAPAKAGGFGYGGFGTGFGGIGGLGGVGGTPPLPGFGNLPTTSKPKEADSEKASDIPDTLESKKESASKNETPQEGINWKDLIEE